MRIKFLVLCLALSFAVSCALAQDSIKREQNQLFYNANGYYEKQDYQKALDEYLKIPAMGLKSGNLYYNIGNTYLKLGKLGSAILYYERARRIMPQDGDLRSNLAYAKSMVGTTASQAPAQNAVIFAIKAPFNELNMNKLTALLLILYFCIILLFTVIILKPMVTRKLKVPAVILGIIFSVTSASFAVRLYEEEIVKRAVVIVKEAEARYEPIDKSTVYYKLQEGDEVSVLKTKTGWRQVRRLDGKVAWVPVESTDLI